MKIYDIYIQNIKLQYLSNVIIKAVHTQNYDKALRTLRTLTGGLSSYVSGCMELASEIQVDVSEYGITDFLTNIVETQKSYDYILMADLIEIQLMPFLNSMQENIRNTCDVMFSEEIWNINLEKLKVKDMFLATQVEQAKDRWLAQDDASYWIEQTNSGLYTMASFDGKGQYYLHSNTNPQVEAAEFAQYYYDMTCDSYVVFGLGLGYQWEELSKLDDGVCINIYENNLDVIVQAMFANVMDWIWDNPNVQLYFDSDLKKMTQELSTSIDKEKDVSFIIHYPSLRHVDNLDIKEKLERIFIRDSGIRNISALMESNFRSNIRNKTDVVDSLRDNFEGKNAIVVAAGPSLDNNVVLLKNKPENTLIIATGTVFKKLMNLGIDIDYVIVADANKRIFGQLAGYMDCKIPMIYLSTACKNFGKEYAGEKYIILQKDFPRAEEEAEKLGVNTYKTGGSVATTALDVCISLGCASIAFVGLDLAYTGNMAHATGTSRRVANDIEDMLKVPGYELSWLSEKEYNVTEVELTASNLFAMYRDWIEKRLKESDVTVPVYDATEGGAVIEGMKIISLAEYYENIL